MGIKLQYNSSTLKVAYNVTEASNKAITTDGYAPTNCPCWAAAQTPEKYSITFSGIQDCPGESGSDLNGTYILRHDDAVEVPDVGEYCSWSYSSDTINIYLRFVGLTVFTVEIRATVYGVGGLAYSRDYVGSNCEDLISQSNISNTLTDICSVGVGYDGIASWSPVI